MAIRKILKGNDPSLRIVCKQITTFDERLGQLFDDLVETMKDARGMGLACPQVAVIKRAAVVEIDGKIIELANPVLISSEGEMVDNEGCLSVEDYRGIVKRPAKIKIEYFDRHGNKQTMEQEGYSARCILHEMDHLDGILFTDKMIKRIELKKEQE